MNLTKTPNIFVLSDGAPSVGEVLDPIERAAIRDKAGKWCVVRTLPAGRTLDYP